MSDKIRVATPPQYHPIRHFLGGEAWILNTDILGGMGVVWYNYTSAPMLAGIAIQGIIAVGANPEGTRDFAGELSPLTSLIEKGLHIVGEGSQARKGWKRKFGVLPAYGEVGTDNSLFIYQPTQDDISKLYHRG